MQTLEELGLAVADRRRALRLNQATVAGQANLQRESLSRLERGRFTDIGVRKLLAVLAVLGLELDVVVTAESGTLDQLRKERGLR